MQAAAAAAAAAAAQQQEPEPEPDFSSSSFSVSPQAVPLLLMYRSTLKDCFWLQEAGLRAALQALDVKAL